MPLRCSGQCRVQACVFGYRTVAPRLTVTHRAAERYSAIERENRILLQKMAQILRTNKTMDTINQYKARSLNREARRRELIRITHENQGILRRIQASEATYNHVEWEEDRRKMERRIDNISHYDRLGREKVLLQIKSQQRLNRTRNGPTRRFRPQSAPTYKAGSGRPRRTFCGMLPCAWVCSGWLPTPRAYPSVRPCCHLQNVRAPHPPCAAEGTLATLTTRRTPCTTRCWRAMAAAIAVMQRPTLVMARRCTVHPAHGALAPAAVDETDQRRPPGDGQAGAAATAAWDPRWMTLTLWRGRCWRAMTTRRRSC